MGSAPCLGGWDVAKAIPLMGEHYPCWKSAEVDVSEAGPGLEYKYLKRRIDGVEWEPGANRRAPVDPDARKLTIHDGNFGTIQPEAFSFHEFDDRPKLEDVATQQRRIVVIGSSVAEGYNSWRKHGWAWLLGEALRDKYGYFLANLSQSGANTNATKERFMQAVCPWKPDIVIVALSLGNEGLAHCPPGERRAAQHRFEDGLLELLRMVVSIGAIPVLGGVYPNNDFNSDTYSMLKETRRTMSSWGVPILDWLDVLDDGRGRWKAGLFFDHAHPNSLGHRKMFEAIDLAVFDPAPSVEVPALARRRSSLAEFDQMVRKTSYSKLDPEVAESRKEEERKVASIAKAFDDGRGFSIVMCDGALSVRNKTSHEYKMSGEWLVLVDALAKAGIRQGMYACRDESSPGCSVLHIGDGARLANAVRVAAGADMVFTQVVAGAGRDR